MFLFSQENNSCILLDAKTVIINVETITNVCWLKLPYQFSMMGLN